jgi:esterase/lipase
MPALPDRQSFLQQLTTTSYGSYLWPAADDTAVFVFVHGFGTHIDDLIPLAAAFHSQSYLCELVVLKGHAEDLAALGAADYQAWHRQLEAVCDYHATRGRRIYIVGFSLGALLALDLAATRAISGIIAISTFLSFQGARSAQQPLVQLLAALPPFAFTRRLQTTSSATQAELQFSPRLPFHLVQAISAEAARVRRQAALVRCPVLLLHSIDDTVADYRTVAALHNTLPARARLVTLRGLKHFLQFDIPPARIRGLALCFLELPAPAEPQAVDHEFLKEVFVQTSEEYRQWASYIFQLILGFFSLIGLTGVFTATSIIEKRYEAPYYALAYSIACTIYLIMVTLYFFYMNRAITYIKHHLEPHMAFVPWHTYRSNIWLAGRASIVTTRSAGMFLVIIPLAICFTSIAYCLYYFPQRFIGFAVENLPLQGMLAIAVGMLIYNVRFGQRSRSWSEREIYGGVLRPCDTSLPFEKLLNELYASVQPGIVTQPFAVGPRRAVPGPMRALLANALAVAGALGRSMGGRWMHMWARKRGRRVFGVDRDAR